jgi:hypothetical protein
MRRCVILLCLATVLLAACAAEPAPTLSPQRGECGDGLCGGPENPQTCPEDCAPPDTSTQSAIPPDDDIPPLYFFYVIHAHVSGDKLPYDIGMNQIDSQVAENMIAAIEGIQGVLDRYGIPASWHLTYGGARGFCDYGGQDHVLNRLVNAGHEVGLHAHHTEDIQTAYQVLTLDCGITPQVGSGHLLDAHLAGQFGDLAAAQTAMTLSLDISSGLGVTIVTENLSPGGDKNVFAEACNDQLGIGNSMWAETGNLMFPWRPDYQAGNICAHNPQSDVLFIDHVSIEFALTPMHEMPDVWGDPEFGTLQTYLDQALAYMHDQNPDRVAVWGFVSHITEYAVGGSAENPPDPSALEALDQFLAFVDAKRAQGLLEYATPGQIADMVAGE